MLGKFTRVALMVGVVLLTGAVATNAVGPYPSSASGFTDGTNFISNVCQSQRYGGMYEPEC